jgi:4a-hydroxytetrahydrobiopterin dehydratase
MGRNWVEDNDRAGSKRPQGKFNPSGIGLAKVADIAAFSLKPQTQPPLMSDILDESELAAVLKKCPEWEVEGKALTRTIEFEEFTEAIDFVNDLAEVAEEAQHHPDIDIRYLRVTVSLSTHEVGGITDADVEIAQRIDNLVD